MSEQIREQVSAFLDGELPGSETELLLKRLTRDPELRQSFGRYALIGETLRGVGGASLSLTFAARVNRTIDGEPAAAALPAARARPLRWSKRLAGTAVAAGVTAVAVVAWQQRAVAPGVTAAAPHVTAQNVRLATVPKEPLSYTVPDTGRGAGDDGPGSAHQLRIRAQQVLRGLGAGQPAVDALERGRGRRPERRGGGGRGPNAQRAATVPAVSRAPQTPP